METPEQHAHLMRQIGTAQRRAAAAAPTATPISRTVEQIAPRNQTAEIERFAAYLQAKVADPNLEPRIAWKVATAVIQKRVPEHLIVGILQSLEYAKKRGAYFVAAAKRAFTKVELSWFEEEWE